MPAGSAGSGDLKSGHTTNNTRTKPYNVLPTSHMPLFILQDPSDPRYEHLGGTSLAPILDGRASKVKDVTLSQFPRCWQNNTHYQGSRRFYCCANRDVPNFPLLPDKQKKIR